MSNRFVRGKNKKSILDYNIKEIIMKSIGYFFCVLSLVMLWTNSLWSDDKSFIIGVEDLDYYPLYSTIEGQYTGYSRDVLDAYAKSRGYTFHYKPYPVARLFYSFLDKQEVEFKYPDDIFWQKDKKEGKNVQYSKPIVNYVDGVLVLPENKGKTQLKKLGIIRGFTAWEYLDAIKNKEIVEEFSNEWDGLINKTFKNRVDGAYCNISVVMYQLRERFKKPNGLVFDSKLPHSKSSYLMSTIKHPKIINDFSEWITQNQPFINKLKLKYMVEAGF